MVKRSSGLTLAILVLQFAKSAGAHGQNPRIAQAYEREVFHYVPEARDPFRSPFRGHEQLVRPEEVVLVGIVYEPGVGRAVATVRIGTDDRIHHVRVGDEFGGLRVLRISAESVDLTGIGVPEPVRIVARNDRERRGKP